MQKYQVPPSSKFFSDLVVRGVVNQECESLNKIWRNKVTEVVNHLKERYYVVVRFQYSEIGWLENSTFHSQWVEQNKCTPASILRMNFQRLLLLHPLQKHFEGVDDVTASTLAPFLGKFRKIEEKKKLPDFFLSLFFLIFLI